MQANIDSILAKMLAYQVKNRIQYTIHDDAPDTFERLQAECSPTRLRVWSGASESSIWGIEGNYLFRAIHDSIHLLYGLSFSDLDEATVCYMSCESLGLNKAERIIMQAEIIGQLEYKAEFGEFPENQREFTINYLKQG